MTTSKVIGRNLQKFKIKFTNAPVLDEVLFMQKSLIDSIAKVQKSILDSSRAVMRWSQTECNFTFTDVLSNWFDLDNVGLFLLLQELQGECMKYRQVYKGIKEEEKVIIELEKKKEAKTNEVHRIKLKINALRKAGSKKVERIDTLEEELTLAEQEEEKLEEDLNLLISEFEKLKARTIKDALYMYSSSWIKFATDTLQIFNTQRQMADDMPSTPVTFEDQVTKSNQILVTKTFKKLNLHKPDHEIKPERESKPEVISPNLRKPSLEVTPAAVDDHSRHSKSNIFASIGNNLGAKLLPHKTSKESLSVEDPVQNCPSSLSRPLPQVPDEVSDDSEDDQCGDDYSILNTENLDEENYVVPQKPNTNGENNQQYTFLNQKEDKPRYPPGMVQNRGPPNRKPPALTQSADEPRYPPGFCKDVSTHRLSLGASQLSQDMPDECEDYLAVIPNLSDEDLCDVDNKAYEHLQPPPRPPKNGSSERLSELSVPAGYEITNILPAPPPLPSKNTSPNPGRKQLSTNLPSNQPKPKKQPVPAARPKVSPRTKKPPIELPTQTIPPRLPPR